ncbi:MAG TPA: ABC transporter ATP-binding protein [Rhodanobacteraceae bacterium]
MIELCDLSRRYGEFVAVDKVSCQIGQGEVVGLLGHNGAGKTTVMKMLTGYLDASSGSIRVDGLAMREARRQIQEKIGYLPENCPVYGDMSVAEYLLFRAELVGVPPAERAPALARALQRTRMTERAQQPIATLSRGLRQRVGVAQAILHQPSIVILDEPTNGLDPSQIRQMRALIRELAEHATVIVSTHILSEVEAVCERVLILCRGKLALDARLADLEREAGLLLETDRADPALEAALGNIDGVSGVTCAEPGTLRLQTSGPWPPVAEAAARVTLQHQHPLRRLQPVQQNLETIFREVNEKAALEVAHA